MRIELKHPAQAHGEDITYIDLPDRAKGKHLRGIPAELTTGDVLDLVAGLAKVPPSTINEMDLEDVNQLLEWFEGFFSPLGSRRGQRQPRRK